MIFFFIILSALFKDSCGFQQRDDEEIIGGKGTNISEVPYQAALFWNGISRPICGGAVIGNKEIITAAHCVKGKSAASFQIRVGSSLFSKGGSIHEVSNITIHDLFHFPHNDIAIVQIQDYFNFSDKIKPVELATTEPQPGSPAIASGWGYLSDFESSTDLLQSIGLTIIDRQECGEIYETFITPDIICAGNSQAKGNSCNGDSGGPLIVNHQLVGIVSFRNMKGCEIDYTSGYSSIAYVRDWLLGKMNDLRQTESWIQNLTANIS